MDRETAVAALQRVAVCALTLHNALADLDPEQSAAYAAEAETYGVLPLPAVDRMLERMADAAEARMETVGAPPVPPP